MPPKGNKATKDIKKSPPAIKIIIPPISESSLLHVPGDAIEGYQNRIEEGIEWTPLEDGARHHKHMCQRVDIQPLQFTEALQNKIRKSYLNGFINEDSGLTLDEQWELSLPITLWDNDKCANEEGKICFRSANSITDNMIPMIRKAVNANDRNLLKNQLKTVAVLRVNDCEMTELDKGLLEYRKLVTLNLCGNFLSGVKANCIPEGVRSIELQANRIHDLKSFSDLPLDMLYLGLCKNLLDNASVPGLIFLPTNILVLDLSDNDIYDLGPLLEMLTRLENLTSLSLAGNPCSVCSAYARATLSALPTLEWLDNRKVLPTDRNAESYETHPNQLRSAYFNFYVYRIMSVPPPPKPVEKGSMLTYHVEVELPLLDPIRRQFLMFRGNESLTEILPSPEDDWESEFSTKIETVEVDAEAASEETDIYERLAPKNSRIITHYTIFESNKVVWNKMMNFQEPMLRIFCPDLVALRNTLRSIITIRLIFTQYIPPPKTNKTTKSTTIVRTKPVPLEQFVTIFSVKCALQRLDWSQPSQHFHWDETLGTNEAIHWGDGDLSVLQYSSVPAKPVKGKPELDGSNLKQLVPDIMTAHFGFTVDMIRP